MNIIMQFPGGLKKALTFSYDDGVRQDIRLVALFDKYGVKGTFNINTGCFGADNPDEIATGKGRMSLREVKELFCNSPHEIAVHGLYHANLTQLDEMGIANEIVTDKKNIENIFGTVTRGAAYAYGTYNDTAIRVLRDSGVVYCRTTQSVEDFSIPKNWLELRSTCHHKCDHLADLTTRFLEPSEEPMLFYVWGHSYEFDNDDNWSVMEDLLKTASGREDVWYATNIEIFDYLAAYNALKYSVDGNLVYNPSALDVFISCDGKGVKIPAGSTVKL